MRALRAIGRVLALVPAFLVFALPVLWVGGASLYLDRAGVVVPGVVTGKQERIDFNYGDWSRESRVVVRFQPPRERLPRVISARVPLARYDALHAGSPVAVRYLPPSGLPRMGLMRTLYDLGLVLKTRLAEQSTAGIVLGWIPAWLPQAAVAAALGIALIAFAVKRLKRASAAVVLGCLVLLWFALQGMDYPLRMPAPRGATHAARAVATAVEDVWRIGEGEEMSGYEASQPMTLVAFRFVPAGRADPVVAVDRIDYGSIPGLAQGAEVAVFYQVDDPRIANLAAGTRTFVTRNLIGIAGEIAAGVIAVLILLGLWYAWRCLAALAAARRRI